MMRNTMLAAGLSVSSALLVGTAPVTQSRSSTVAMASIIETAASLQGPEIFWGAEGPKQDPMKEESDLKGYDSFNTFLGAVKDAGLEDTLKGGEYTVFAPTDSVFADFVSNGGKVTPELVKYHVVEGKVTTSQFSSASLKTLEGSSLTYRRMYRKDFIDDATPGVKSEGPSKSSNWPSDVACDNGVLHSCNAVLTPGWEAVN